MIEPTAPESAPVKIKFTARVKRGLALVRIIALEATEDDKPHGDDDT